MGIDRKKYQLLKLEMKTFCGFIVHMFSIIWRIEREECPSILLSAKVDQGRDFFGRIETRMQCCNLTTWNLGYINPVLYVIYPIDTCLSFSFHLRRGFCSESEQTNRNRVNNIFVLVIGCFLWGGGLTHWSNWILD